MWMVQWKRCLKRTENDFLISSSYLLYFISRLCVSILWYLVFVLDFYIKTYSHSNDVIMSAMASQITSLTIVYDRLFRRRSKKASKLRVTGLCAGTSPGTGEFPAQMVSNAENVSICWRHHVKIMQHGSWELGLFTKRVHDLLQDLAKTRSREIRV